MFIHMRTNKYISYISKVCMFKKSKKDRVRNVLHLKMKASELKYKINSIYKR